MNEASKDEWIQIAKVLSMISLPDSQSIDFGSFAAHVPEPPQSWNGALMLAVVDATSTTSSVVGATPASMSWADMPDLEELLDDDSGDVQVHCPAPPASPVPAPWAMCCCSNREFHTPSP